jgi:hypothetical protein
LAERATCDGSQEPIKQSGSSFTFLRHRAVSGCQSKSLPSPREVLSPASLEESIIRELDLKSKTVRSMSGSTHTYERDPCWSTLWLPIKYPNPGKRKRKRLKQSGNCPEKCEPRFRPSRTARELSLNSLCHGTRPVRELGEHQVS